MVAGMRTRWGDRPRLAGATLPPYAARAPGDAQRGAARLRRVLRRAVTAPTARAARHGGSIVDGSYLALVSDQALRTAVIAGRPDLGMPDWRADVPGRADDATARSRTWSRGWSPSARSSPAATDDIGQPRKHAWTASE